ncbi:MarR family winged helix-turn-helix transcriptional regulator [Asticcacaulis sp. AC402]|uniref:MarR family winged helix-turn-helix transcriptional regulator n=1 Tax=Asticcacaulis sp. AC402 TaxID=1282361 RepID=UPI0003C3ACA7|nr:MarR family transcriptional regulator [Asticcacaulis sp. AC402]ESQ75053.1 MarR family transcriptional regulator [Asticcacaulis sp. AC402]
MTRTPSPPELRLDSQICFAVYSAAHAFAQAYRPWLEPLGLTYPQYLVMLVLWERDGRSVTELAQPLQLDSGTLTPLLKRMEKAGFLTRGRDDKDERITRIHLTDFGQSLRDQARRIPAAMLCHSGMDLNRLTELREHVQELGRTLRQA